MPNVVMRTCRTASSIRYEVLVEHEDGHEEPIHLREVLFGTRDAQVAGGAAFRLAAREQEERAADRVRVLRSDAGEDGRAHLG